MMADADWSDPVSVSGEKARLAALARYDILDSPPERPFDELAVLASQICGTPIALITFIDERRGWFKASVGLQTSEVPRNVAFCSEAIMSSDVLLLSDI